MLQGDNKGNYGGLGDQLKRRSNNIRF